MNKLFTVAAGLMLIQATAQARVAVEIANSLKTYAGVAQAINAGGIKTSAGLIGQTINGVTINSAAAAEALFSVAKPLVDAAAAQNLNLNTLDIDRLADNAIKAGVRPAGAIEVLSAHIAGGNDVASVDFQAAAKNTRLLDEEAAAKLSAEDLLANYQPKNEEAEMALKSGAGPVQLAFAKALHAAMVEAPKACAASNPNSVESCSIDAIESFERHAEQGFIVRGGEKATQFYVDAMTAFPGDKSVEGVPAATIIRGTNRSLALGEQMGETLQNCFLTGQP